MANNQIPIIEPKEMPQFLNELATKYFQDDQEIWHKLIQCSVYIHGVNSLKYIIK